MCTEMANSYHGQYLVSGVSQLSIVRAEGPGHNSNEPSSVIQNAFDWDTTSTRLSHCYYSSEKYTPAFFYLSSTAIVHQVDLLNLEYNKGYFKTRRPLSTGTFFAINVTHQHGLEPTTWQTHYQLRHGD